MRRITVSVLSIFVVFSANAATTRLPVVNIGAGGVSARAAFGVGEQRTSRASAATTNDVAAPAPTVTSERKVVARAAAPVKMTKVSAPVKPDAPGGKKIAAADVLVPQRPSADLWAQSDTPLRMPRADEISLVRADYDLPEESLDSAPRIANARTTSTGALDAEIDRLVALQRAADASHTASSSRRVIAAPIADTPVAPAPAPVAIAHADPAPVAQRSGDDIALRRLVVPMDDDVVVRAVKKSTSPRITAVRDDMTSLSPSELRRAFRKTYLSENKHLSTYQIDDRFDVVSDMSASIEGFTAKSDLSEGSGVRPLEIKIKFRGDDSALSRENYNLLTEYAGIVVNNPKRAIQVAIPQSATTNQTVRRLAARRLSIVEQVLRDTGVSEQRIMPVLSQRDDEAFVLRIISGEQYETLSKQKRDMFGDTVSKKTYTSMSW